MVVEPATNRARKHRDVVPGSTPESGPRRKHGGKHSGKRCVEHSGQRGAAIFIVVMATTLLTAVGIFAIRATSLVDMASGYNRQAVQTGYVTEYGALAALAQLGFGASATYANLIMTSSDECRATADVTPPLPGERVPCYQLHRSEIDEQVDRNFPGTFTFEVPNDATNNPGSLGPYLPATDSSLEGDFVVELTDPGLSPMPAPGFEEGTSQSLQVTMTVIGQVRPFVAGEVCNANASTLATQQQLRAHAVLVLPPGAG